MPRDQAIPLLLQPVLFWNSVNTKAAVFLVGARARIEIKTAKKNRMWKAIKTFSMCGRNLDRYRLMRKAIASTAQ
jgi:hypothetical protein